MHEWEVYRPLPLSVSLFDSDSDLKGEAVVTKAAWCKATVVEHCLAEGSIWVQLQEVWPGYNVELRSSDVYRHLLSSKLAQRARLLEPPNLDRFEAHAGLDERWLDGALECFRHNGFVILRNALSRNKCCELLRACEQAEVEIRHIRPRGNRGPGRSSFGVASKTGSMLHQRAWAQLLDCEALLDLLEVIFPEGGECVSGGGDLVFEEGGGSCHQRLHSDL